MSALKKCQPANDLQPGVLQDVSCVAWSLPMGKNRKIAIAAALAGFAALILVFFVSALREKAPRAVLAAQEETAAASQSQKMEPFDIRLSGRADGSDYIEYAREEKASAQGAMTPVLEVKVEGDGAGNAARADSEAQAQRFDAMARKLLRQGDARQALVYQRHAVNLDGKNQGYRLRLAIIQDRLSNAKSASVLYGQVIRAYEKHDQTLPADLDIEQVRARLDYLNARQ
jgi:hypothetical protein